MRAQWMWQYCILFPVLQNLDALCTKPNFREIFWCFSEATVPQRQLDGCKQRDKILFYEGLPEFENEQSKRCLIILDDLLNEVYSKDACDIFTKGSHHRNISVILITQNLCHQGHYTRDMLLNAKYLVIYKNVRYKNQFLYLADRFIRRIVIVCTKIIWKLHRDRTFTCGLI